MRDYYESGESDNSDEPHKPINQETKDNLIYYICRFQHDIYHLAHSCRMYIFAYPN